MRTNLIRHSAAVAILVISIAATALAQQPVVRGKVVDESDKPVQDAVVVFAAQFQQLKRDTKTDSKGEFVMVGLPPGQYEVTATKEGVGTETINHTFTQNQNIPFTMILRPASPLAGGATAKATSELQALARAGSTHLAEGRNDEAIAAFTQLVDKAPSCGDCFVNLGIGHANKKQYAEAEAAFKKAIELKPDDANAHSQLAGIYNAQRKFDLAAESSAAAAKYAAAAPGATGGSAEALYNQGVALFNGGKYPDAKNAFEGATKADPKNALAHYQLGMTALNLGDFALAVSSLERYLVLEPNGAKAAEVKASLPALKGMVKK